MTQHPANKERKAAHAAESESISKRIAEGDDFPELGRVWSELRKIKLDEPCPEDKDPQAKGV